KAKATAAPIRKQARSPRLAHRFGTEPTPAERVPNRPFPFPTATPRLGLRRAVARAIPTAAPQEPPTCRPEPPSTPRAARPDAECAAASTAAMPRRPVRTAAAATPIADSSSFLLPLLFLQLDPLCQPSQFGRVNDTVVH